MLDHPTPNSAGAVFGRYVLVESIGRGAMGEVWVAIDLDLDRKVALKLLRQDRAGRVKDRARLLAEARAMARLTHPNVVTVHDVGEVDGQLFIAMEYVDGETLDAWLARGPYPWQEALAVMRQAGAGLASAHDVGLVHRDFKPANVMIGHDRRARVLDFGLARPEGIGQGRVGAGDSITLESDDDGRVLRARSRPDVGATPHVRIQGTPYYMSPEQHRGDPIDARSDLFSFCVVLFEALYGARPFGGAHRLAVAMNITGGEVLDIPVEERAPPWIHQVIMQGLAREPGQRPADMETLLSALERSPAQLRRRRRVIAAAGAVGLGLAGLLVALVPGRDPGCDHVQSSLVKVWSPAQWEQLRARVDRASPPASLASQRLGEGFRRYEEEWIEAKGQLCRDRRTTRMSSGLYEVRERCLQDRLEALAAITWLAADHVDSALISALAAHPYGALRSLGAPSMCVDHGPGSEEIVALDGADARAHARARLILTLAPADASRLVAAELDQVAESTTGANYDRSRELLYGRAALAAGDLELAERRLHAVARASAGTRPSLAAEAWLALVERSLAELAGRQRAGPLSPVERSARRSEASHLLNYAAATLDPDDFARGVELTLLRARVALALDERATAMATLDAAITHSSREPVRAPDLLAALLELRAQLHLRGGSTEAAADDRERAKIVLSEALGPR